MTIKIAFIGTHQQEVHIFDTAFSQRKFETKKFPPFVGSYLELLKFKPDAILLELPQDDREQLHLVNLIRNNKKLSSTSLICYGNELTIAKRKQYNSVGILNYYPRPLKISRIFQALIKLIGPEVEKLLHETQTEQSAKTQLVLLSPKTPMHEKIEIMVEEVGKLMAFPNTIGKIVDLTHSDNSSTHELAQVISTDASIATSIVKLSNSVVFSSLNRDITTIHDAIIRIGFEATQQVAIGLSVIQLIDTKEMKTPGFNRTEFWYHSLATALFTEKLAKRANHPNPALAFLCGLLHDYASLLYDCFFEDIFEMLIEHTHSNNCSFAESGLSLLRLDQNIFMAELFSKWNMPRDLILTLEESSNDISDSDLPHDQSTLIRAVTLADQFAKASRIGRSSDEILYSIPHELFSRFRLEEDFPGSFFKSTLKKISFFIDYLGVEHKELPETIFSPSSGATPLTLGIINNTGRPFDSHLFYLTSTGFTEKPIGSPQELLEQSHSLSLAIYYCIDNESAETISAYQKSIKENSIPTLIFYSDSAYKALFSPNDTVRTFHTTTDAQSINSGIKELLGDSIIVQTPFPIEDNDFFEL
ncbi:MAG: HDOD domain-containing protein [Fibrobacterales bacterium]